MTDMMRILKIARAEVAKVIRKESQALDTDARFLDAVALLKVLDAEIERRKS